jgi:hypothetical protein
VFKESQIFEQFVRSVIEGRPQLKAFEEFTLNYEKKQQELALAAQNQETIGSFLDE